MECNTYCNGSSILEDTKEYRCVKLLLNNILYIRQKRYNKREFQNKSNRRVNLAKTIGKNKKYINLFSKLHLYRCEGFEVIAT